MTIDDLVATIRRRLGEHGEYLAALHRDRDVDGYLAACQAFDKEMAGHARALIDLIGETEKVREHARTKAQWEEQAKRCEQFRAGLVEALDLLSWCAELGHQPTPQQLARAEELRKLART